ncbi:MAG: HAD family hydrolase [Coriobacteriaceae bacterium]|jgi:FMN phosphatase YigB (HAD superfamily)|nr:HAD family hydrolase [Coriobacteriaceae bacterium]
MDQGPYKAIFFDLDGTLLPMDMEEFMGAYLAAITEFVGTHGLEQVVFSAGLYSGIKAMSGNEGGRTNADVFWDTFFDAVDEDRDTWISLFGDFYENEFNAIGKDVAADPHAVESVRLLQEKGYPLVLATMPMFPLRAVEWRLGWAGLEAADFQRITHFANSTSVKPHLAYFEENLTAAGLKPQEVLMVGNNTREDLACQELGMDVWLITDFLINSNDFDLDTVKHGSFEDFVAWVRDLPPCADAPVSFVAGLVEP